jgi:hypothetical protein
MPPKVIRLLGAFSFLKEVNVISNFALMFMSWLIHHPVIIRRNAYFLFK